MKKLLLLLFLLTVTGVANAREWTAYMSYHNATYNQPAAGLIYSLCNGSIYSYHPGDTKVNIFSKATGLSDCSIKLMKYNEKEGAFLLVYDDYNMDVVGTNDSITNMPEFKNSNLEDKTVNDITMNGFNAYLATNSGIVVVNMKRREFSSTYKLGAIVTSCACIGDKIIVSSPKGLYSGDVSDNLLDVSNWKHLSSVVMDHLLPFNGKLYAHGNDGIYRIDIETGNAVKIANGNYTYYNMYNGVAVFGNATQIVMMDNNESLKTLNVANDFQMLSYDGNSYWASRGDKGLQPFILQGDSLKPAADAIIPNSPIRNLTYFLSYTPNNRLLVGGGSLNYTYKFYPGTVMAFDQGKWINFDEDRIAIKTGIPYENVTSVIEDPKDDTHHFVSAAGGGLYEFRNGRFVKLYSCDNSPLSTILPHDAHPKEYVRTSGLTYDKFGNLWILNNEVDSILKIWMTNGSWKRFYFSTLAGFPTFDKILLDSRGIAWITHRRTTSVHFAGILAFYFGSSIEDESDDSWKFRYQFTNQDNTTYSFNQVYDVVEDRDGYIWIATNQGPFVLTNPTDFFGDSPVFTQVKVPRNDGTNYADYLLTGVPITCIAIDGGNRKWFGTSGNGIYLVSADGLTTIHHFTAENSPLLSNVIYSMAINPKTGEVMIGTDAGLIGYRSDATEPQETLEKSNVKVYPNPVRPDFEGNVRVDGLSFDSDVKITTASGQVVAQGRSVGGTFTWNLRDKSGDHVSTGVYYVIAADEAGKKGAVAKFLVVK
ncbi:MAG: two-component regulator propeller domain-containing protein [Bacteroidaceae bacterium]